MDPLRQTSGPTWDSCPFWTIRSAGSTGVIPEAETASNAGLQMECGGHLPPQEATDWGKPEARTRLRKIITSLKGFVDLAERREDSDMGIAVQHRERDVAFLEDEFKPVYPDLIESLLE